MLQTPLILDADMSVPDALDRAGAYPPDASVVVRRRSDLEVRFYTFTIADLLAALNASVGADRLGAVLRLDHRQAAPTRQLLDPGGAADPAFEGVLLDGVGIVGVRRAMSRAVRPAAAGGVPRPVAPPAAAAESTRAPVSRGGGLLARMRGGLGGRRTRSARGGVRAGNGGGSPGVEAGSAAVEATARPEESAAPSNVRFQAHPRLELESDVVEPGTRFDLVIGLAREAVAGVAGSLVSAEIDAGARHLDLDVQVVADEFEAPAGWHFRLRLAVDAPDSARLAVPLIAPPGAMVRQSLLEVHFSHGGVPAGIAFRPIVVRPGDGANAGRDGRGPGAAAPGLAGEPWLQPSPAPDLLIDPAEPPPDLWITISKPDGNEATGRFVWSFQSPHPIDLPREPLLVDLGDDARTFAGRMIRLVAENEGSELIDEALAGLGRQIRDRAPAELGEVLRRVRDAVSQASGAIPTILLHSAEAHVPWELTVLEDPPDPGLPPFLGAQFAVGRWLLGPRSVRIPPAREVEVRSMAVVVGDYKSSRRLRPLPEAEAEGETLVGRYGAIRLAATAPELDRLLGARLPAGPDDAASVAEGERGAEAIHFACHGEVDPGNAATGRIYLNDDQPLDPVHFIQAGIGRTHQPFLFLNACQVGQAGELLGDYAGFAGSCLRNGFRGFVAPLWSVDDTIARTIAMEFYERAFGDDGAGPTPVAEVLRAIRARFPRDQRIPPSTWLAYVFYGNPRLILRRA